MDRVDFLGAPGVGKTTLYATLQQRRRPLGGDWLTTREARFVVAGRLARARGPTGWLMLSGLHVPRLREALTEYLLAANTERTLRRSAELAALLELWQDVIGATLQQGERTLALLPWVRRTGVLALFVEHLAGWTILEDESYSKLACGFLTGISAPVAVSREFFRRYLAPAAVIWLRHPEPTEIARRLVRRVEQRGRDGSGRLRFGDRLWHENELVEYVHERMRYDMEAVSVLRDRDVPLLEVSAAEPMEHQAEAVERFVRSSLAPARPAVRVAP
jgi:hypothetical protein